MISDALAKFVKTGLKQLSPSLHRHLLLKRMLSRLPDQYRDNSPMTIIMDDKQAGLFALYFQVIGAIDYCQVYHHDLSLQFNKGFYYDPERGGSWWDYYFENSFFRFSNNQAIQELNVNDLTIKDQFNFYGRDLHPTIANRIIPHITIRNHIIQKVDQFISQHFRGKKVIGLHYRGTDKVGGDWQESVRVPYDYVYSNVSECPSDALIFVATDEAQFLEFMNNRFPGRIVSYDAIRSINGVPVHIPFHTRSSAYKAGEDALIDCLLLSRCNLLIRTDSNLSQASMFISPELKTINITEKYLK